LIMLVDTTVLVGPEDVTVFVCVTVLPADVLVEVVVRVTVAVEPALVTIDVAVFVRVTVAFAAPFVVV
jgi:hypothetical protein